MTSAERIIRPVSDARRPQRAPSGLSAGGRALWRAVTTEYECRDDELKTLEGACRLVDELARIEAELATQPVMVDGSKGQQRPNPLFDLARNHRLAVQKLLSSLDLPERPDAATGQERSARGRALARMRWGSHGA